MPKNKKSDQPTELVFYDEFDNYVAQPDKMLNSPDNFTCILKVKELKALIAQEVREAERKAFVAGAKAEKRFLRDKN